MPLNFLKRNFISPLLEFIYDSRAIGIILIISTALSLMISNSAWGSNYISLWNYEFHLPSQLPHTLLY